MASYAALVSLESTLEKFISQDQFQILDDEHKRQSFILLMQNVALLLKFLDSYPGTAPQLEKRITRSADAAECLIENYVWLARFHGKLRYHGLIKLFFPIKHIATKIDSIVREAEEIKSNAIAQDGSRSEGEPLSLRESGIRKNKDKVVGFDDELVRVKDHIFWNDSKMLSIPIVGMGGVGKTTLARAAFDDPAVVRRFDIRRYLTVSQKCDYKVILRAILDEESSNQTVSLKDLSVKVHQLLLTKPYIIVLDDIWSLDAWYGVKRFLPDNTKGSRVLLTTRDENVAIHASGSSTAIHHLGLMDKRKSWSLFEQKVFGEGACCPHELVKLGEMIVEGCKGLPLAIVVIAGILSNIKPTRDSWERIAKDVRMALSKEGDQLSEILSLSYHHLSRFLKSCFLHIGAFPEDHDIHVSNLVKMWVAEGFLKAEPLKRVEEIAYGYLESLAARNLIMVTQKRYNGEIKICRIHDHLRKLSIRLAEEEKFMDYVNDKNKGISSECESNARRISFSFQVSSQSMDNGLFSLHTALCFHHDQHLISRLMSCRLLRVLDIAAVKSRKFPSQLSQLYHLRYLAFTYKSKMGFELPNDICNLKSLETLIARHVYRVGNKDMFIIPREFWTMKNLRHVVCYCGLVLPDPVSQMCPLENLLSILRLCNFRCKEEVVELMPNVRKIGVCYELDPQRENWNDYMLENFARFSDLESLRIELKDVRYELDWCKRNPFLDCLVLPQSLRRLSIIGCAARIPWEDMTAAISLLPNLESLKLCHNVCSGDVWETKEGAFENLRILEIRYTDLKYWNTERCSHFTNLERLVLRRCGRIAELPDCIGDLPTLQLIDIDDHQKVVVDWAQRVAEQQWENGNELFRIEVNDAEDGDTKSMAS